MPSASAPRDTAAQLGVRLTAISSEQRMRILAELNAGDVHVSELARRVQMSRPLLYMHLTKLEEAGFVASRLELGPDGKAVRVFEAVPFSISLTPTVIADAVAASQESEK